MVRSKSSPKTRSISFNPFTSKIFSLLLIIFGAGLILLSAISHFDIKLPTATNREYSDGKNVDRRLAKPVKLYIPKLSRILYVSDGKIVDNRWTVSATGVSYLISSALPGSEGNSVLYGHNTSDILGGLWRVQDGDFFYIVMDDGQFYKYKVFERKEITPDQVDILTQTKDFRLTIYTCSGFLDSARYAVVSKLESI